MGCGCGCNSNVSYGNNNSCSKQYAGIYFCKDPVCYVKTTFIVPIADVTIDIEVTDSSRLYKGEGIQIGTGYFQIVAIADANNISIAHSGTASPGLTIVAIQPTYGCYQYPILFVGGIWLPWIPVLVGWSTVPPVGVYRYRVSGKTCFLAVYQSGAAVSDSVNTTIALPLPAAAVSGMFWSDSIAQAVDNSVSLTSPGLVSIASSGTVATLYPNSSGSAWTASGQKLARFQTSYQIA